MNITAVQIFAKALNMTEAELFKQMEQGKLISAEVLPKVAQAYKEAAKQGGAYNEALKGLRVTEGQLITQSQRAANTIFKSGFEGGLSNFYKTLSESFAGMEPQLRKLGRLFGAFFNGLAKLIEMITPLLKILIDNFELIFGAVAIKKMMAFVGGSKAIKAALLSMTVAFKSFSVSTAKSMALAMLPITAAIALVTGLMELIGSWDDSTVNMIEASRGYQIKDGKHMEIKQIDGEWYSTGVELDSPNSRKSMHTKSRMRSPSADHGYQGFSNLKIGADGRYLYNTDVTINVDGSKDPKQVAMEIDNQLNTVYNSAMKGSSK